MFRSIDGLFYFVVAFELVTASLAFLRLNKLLLVCEGSTCVSASADTDVKY